MGLSISAAVRSAWQRAAAALLPQDCVLCGQGSGAGLLCRGCTDSLPHLPPAACPVCALPTPGGAVCGACLAKAPHFDAAIAAFIYAFPIDKLVQQLKFAHRLAIADLLAGAVAERGLPHADLVVPVPLSPLRLRERGFNQAAEIARALGRRCGVAFDLSACRRTLEAPPQSSLPWKERRRNVRGAFECRADLAGKTVIAVDDVMTTGSTLDELARALKDQGATRVIAAVAARAVKHGAQ